MTPDICTLCTPDWWLVVIGAVPAFAAGVAITLGARRALDQDDFPDDDPHAPTFADSEGGRRG